MLANSGLTLIVATWLGLVGAALAEVVVGRRRGRAEAPRAVGADVRAHAGCRVTPLSSGDHL